MSVRTIVGAGALVLLSRVGNAQTRATLDPKPRASATKLAQGLARFAGQTRFITTDYGRGDLGRTNVDAPLGPASELFSHGPVHSNALLLVNRYRGLLVLQKDEHEETPRVIGRVPPTGHLALSLFVDWERQRAIVVEEGSRLLWYDLQDLHAPRLAHTLTIDGDVSAARCSGDLLHLFGRRTGVTGRNPWSGLETFVRSVSLKDGFQAGADFSLSRHVDQFGDLRFHGDLAVAVSKTERRVEVVDVSAADGHIEPVLVAIPGGEVVDANWVHVRDGHLIVASRRSGRVVLERFSLPGRVPSEIVSPRELQFRELAIERELGPEASESRRHALITNNNLDRVITEETSKRGIVTRTKPVADFPAVALGDANHVREIEFARDGVRVTVDARLEIRRYSDFVRERNLEFRGPLMASRRIPYGDHEATVGFMNLDVGVTLRLVIPGGDEGTPSIRELPLPGLRWNDDAVIHLRTDEASGRTKIMFSSTDASGREGGQIITVDARAEDSAGVLTSAGFVAGDWSWLKRLFFHPEFKAALTFTDLQLGLFSTTGTQTVELARDVVDRNTFAEVVARGARTELRLTRAEGAVESVWTEGHFVAWSPDDAARETLVLAEKNEGLHFAVTFAKVDDERIESRQAEFTSRDGDGPRLLDGPRGLIAVAPRRWVFLDERKRLIGIDAREGLKVAPVDLAGLSGKLPIDRTELMVLEGRPYAFARPYSRASENDLHTDNLFVPLDFTDDKPRPLGRVLHVPGRPEGVVTRKGKPRFVLTSELRPLESPAVVESQLNLLEIDGGVAFLRDVVPFEEHLTLHRVSETRWMFLERSPPKPFDGAWGSKQKYNLGVFEVGTRGARIHRAWVHLDQPILAHHARLLTVLPNESRRARRAIVSTGRDLTIYDVDWRTRVGTPLRLQPLDTFVTDSTPTSRWQLPDYLDAVPRLEGGLVRVPLGLYGSCEARLISE